MEDCVEKLSFNGSKILIYNRINNRAKGFVGGEGVTIDGRRVRANISCQDAVVQADGLPDPVISRGVCEYLAVINAAIIGGTVLVLSEQ